MNIHELSAFEAYAAKKKKKNKKVNNTVEFKKKKKLINNSANGVLKTLIKTTESNYSNNSNNMKNSNKPKLSEKKNLIKSLLKAKKESIFKDCILTEKVDNVFLKENTVKPECSKESPDIKETPKRLKKVSENKSDNDNFIKRKVTKNLESFKNEKNYKEENMFEVNEFRESEFKTNDINPNNEIVKPRKKNKLKDTNTLKSKLPKLIYSDSVKLGEEVLSWILSPVSLNDFFQNCWEQKPLHIQHNNPNYFNCLCSLENFNHALLENDMYFTKNIDVTSFINDERFTENLVGKAKPSVVWDYFNNGKSIRLLNPQTFFPNIRLINTILQEFFQCFVGANIYLTPPGTQGFAPHYDDIEAFVLQLEGEKHWKLYNPRHPDEVLPRESSKNFKENEIGDPIMELTLKPGDILYFPRGFIHQAKCLPHVHSLHVTVSCYQKNSWADLFEKVLPVALQRAINEDVEFRKGLPIGYLNHLGMVYYDKKSDFRRELINKFEELAQKIMKYCPLDAAVDQLGAKFMHDALPPYLTEEESIYGANRDVKAADKSLLDALKNYSDRNLSVKLIRATSVRLVSEEEDLVLYYTTDNSLVYQEHEVQRVIIPTNWAQAIDHLILSYPKFVEMQQLPVFNKFNKPGKWKRIAEFVYFLWQKGLLLFDRPLLQIYS